MKSKFKDLLEAGIVTAPSAFGAKPISNKPVSSQTGAFGGGSTPTNDVQPGERPNPFTVTPTPAPVAPAPVAPAPAPVAPAQPKFNPTQPFGPVIPTVPSVQPGTEYTPTPGSMKPGSTPATPTPAPVAPAPSTPSTPNPSPRGTGKAKSQYEVNRAASDAEFEKFKAFQARKQERAAILAKTRQAEAETAAAQPQPSTSGMSRGTGTSGRRVFENYTRMQFKQGSLKSLLNEVSGLDLFNLGKYVTPYVAPAVNLAKNVTKKAADIASGAWKYSTDPASAAKTMIKYTTPTPGESEAVRGIKTLIGYSPDTIARMQARRGAAASAFDTATANEKLRHYEKMFTYSNPASLTTKALSTGIGALAGASDKMGIGGKLATGLAGNLEDIVNYQVAAQAKEAARQKFARQDDWRVLTR